MLLLKTKRRSVTFGYLIYLVYINASLVTLLPECCQSVDEDLTVTSLNTLHMNAIKRWYSRV